MSSFEDRIIAMERELRDLKTAHNRGLGVVSFFAQTTFTSAANSLPWYLKATGNNSSLFPFLAQIAMAETSIQKLSTKPVEVDAENNSITWHFYPPDSAGGNIWPLLVVSTDALVLEAGVESFS